MHNPQWAPIGKNVFEIIIPTERDILQGHFGVWDLVLLLIYLNNNIKIHD